MHDFISADQSTETSDDPFTIHGYDLPYAVDHEDEDDEEGNEVSNSAKVNLTPQLPPLSPEPPPAFPPPLSTTDNDTAPARPSARLKPRFIPDDRDRDHDRDRSKPIYLKDLTSAQLCEHLEHLEEQIFQRNNGKSFNINSPRQVSIALYGETGHPTNKDTLEACNHAMAPFILQYRQAKALLNKQKTEESTIQSGRKVATITTSNDPLLLVDASAYIFRAYYSMPPIHRADGMPVGAVMGFCNMLNRIVLDELLPNNPSKQDHAAPRPPRLILVFDPSGHNFRHELYEDYKANRKECPMDLAPQFDLIQQAADAYGIPRIQVQGYEADDVIATLATKAHQEYKMDTHILSGDKDLMQLITEEEDEGGDVERSASPYIGIVDPMSMSKIDADAVREKWGVPPSLVGDVLSLAGDASDNVPGVKGIGPKIAAELLNEYGSLEALLENADRIKQKSRRERLQEGKEMAILSRKLVDLERHIPKGLWEVTREGSIDTEFDLETSRVEPVNPDRLLAFYDEMGFRDLRRRLENRLNSGNPTYEEKKRVIKTTRSRSRPKATVPNQEDFDDVPF